MAGYKGYLEHSKMRIYIAVFLMVLSPLFVTNRAHAATLSFSANAAATVINSGKTVYLNSATYGTSVSIDSVTRLMTGYAWSEEAGWIYFGSGTDNPAGPVAIDECGRLTGKAKVLTGDYIDFNASPYSSKVYIDSAGAFKGYAWSVDLGWIDFTGVTSDTGFAQASACVAGLMEPLDGATNVDVLPEFRIGGLDLNNDYMRYGIDVCSDNTCSTIVRTIDQTVSQIGWSAQSVQDATAYSGGPMSQLAIHRYQAAALIANTQYWWRARAVDPAGVNVWSSYSQIASFTTVPASADNDISIGGGGITINGGTIITTGN